MPFSENPNCRHARLYRHLIREFQSLITTNFTSTSPSSWLRLLRATVTRPSSCGSVWDPCLTWRLQPEKAANWVTTRSISAVLSPSEGMPASATTNTMWFSTRVQLKMMSSPKSSPTHPHVPRSWLMANRVRARPTPFLATPGSGMV